MLNLKTFFIRERIGMLKLSDTYDILDPETKTQIGIAKERPGYLIHALRMLIHKRLLPTAVFVYEGPSHEDESRLLFSIKRGVSLLRARVKICDRAGNALGTMQSKIMSIGGAFTVYDTMNNEVASIKGDWKGWNFKVSDRAGIEIGTITKKWAGIGKELFTSADNYIISLDRAAGAETVRMILAACLAIDVVYKEQ